jgi:hypothetical protein
MGDIHEDEEEEEECKKALSCAAKGEDATED